MTADSLASPPDRLTGQGGQPDQTPTDRPDRDRVTFAGVAAVAIAAAVMSFASWSRLATLTGFDGALDLTDLTDVKLVLRESWLLPIAVDAYAMTATRVWLGGIAVSLHTRAWAKWNAIGAIALSIAGNALYHGLTAHGETHMIWISVGVGGIAPLMFGLVVHLAVLWRDDLRAGQSDDERQSASAAPVALTGQPDRNPVEDYLARVREGDRLLTEHDPDRVEDDRRLTDDRPDRSESPADPTPPVADRPVGERRTSQPDRPLRVVSQAGDDEYMPAVRQYLTQTERPSREGLRQRLGVGSDRARRLLDRGLTEQSEESSLTGQAVNA